MTAVRMGSCCSPVSSQIVRIQEHDASAWQTPQRGWPKTRGGGGVWEISGKISWRLISGENSCKEILDLAKKKSYTVLCWEKNYSYPNQITHHPYLLQRSNERPLNYPNLNNFRDFTTGQQGLIITPLYLKRKLVPTTHGLKLSTTKEEQGFLLEECFRWN